METSPPVDNTHNFWQVRSKKLLIQLDNTHNSTKPDVEMQDKKVCFSFTYRVLIYTLMGLILYTSDIFI